jgi:hypothetical protein
MNKITTPKHLFVITDLYYELKNDRPYTFTEALQELLDYSRLYENNLHDNCTIKKATGIKQHIKEFTEYLNEYKKNKLYMKYKIMKLDEEIVEYKDNELLGEVNVED